MANNQGRNIVVDAHRHNVRQGGQFEHNVVGHQPLDQETKPFIGHRHGHEVFDDEVYCDAVDDQPYRKASKDKLKSNQVSSKDVNRDVHQGPNLHTPLPYMDAMDGYEVQRSLPFLDASADDDDDKLIYSDPSDNFDAKHRRTKAFHLELDDRYCQSCFVREHEVEEFIANMDDDKLFGMNEHFGTMAYAVQVSEKVEDLK